MVSPCPEEPPVEADSRECVVLLCAGLPPVRKTGRGGDTPPPRRLLHKAHLSFRGPWPRVPARAWGVRPPGEKTGLRSDLTSYFIHCYALSSELCSSTEFLSDHQKHLG